MGQNMDNRSFIAFFDIIDEHLAITNDITKQILKDYPYPEKISTELKERIEKSISKINRHPRLASKYNKEIPQIKELREIANVRQEYFEKRTSYHKQDKTNSKELKSLEEAFAKITPKTTPNLQNRLRQIEQKREQLLAEKTKLEKIKNEDKREMAIKELFSIRPNRAISPHLTTERR